MESEWSRARASANASYGHLTFAELVDLGFTENQIRGLVRSMRLERTTRPYYRVVGSTYDWKAKLWLYVDASDGIATHASAAMLHGLGSPGDLSPGFAEITATRNQTSIKRLRVYQRRDLEVLPKTRVDGIACATVAGCLLDLAADHPLDRFLDAYNVALRTRKVTYEQLIAATQTDARRRNRRPMLKAIQQIAAHNSPPKSEWSLWAVRTLTKAGIPTPQLEVDILDTDGNKIACVDLYWPAYRLVIELDGRPHHDRHAAFERDRARDAQLAAVGILVIRITWNQYTQPGYLTRIIRDTITHRHHTPVA